MDTLIYISNALFIAIGFACLGICISMMLEQIYEWGLKIPRVFRCDKCIAFWTCLVYTTVYLHNQYGFLIAGIAAIISIYISKRL